MSGQLWRRVSEELGKHDYMTGIERTVERVQATAEVFTPSELVLEILQYLDLNLFAPGKTVLDPACGDGQFLVAAKAIKVHHHGMSPDEALLDLFGVDIMRDNVDLCRRRLGGGTIVMGDALAPSRRIDGQTEEEFTTMLTLFSDSSSASPRSGSRGSAAAFASKRDRKPIKRVRHSAESKCPTLFDVSQMP